MSRKNCCNAVVSTSGPLCSHTACNPTIWYTRSEPLHRSVCLHAACTHSLQSHKAFIIMSRGLRFDLLGRWGQVASHSLHFCSVFAACSPDVLDMTKVHAIRPADTTSKERLWLRDRGDDPCPRVNASPACACVGQYFTIPYSRAIQHIAYHSPQQHVLRKTRVAIYNPMHEVKLGISGVLMPKQVARP